MRSFDLFRFTSSAQVLCANSVCGLLGNGGELIADPQTMEPGKHKITARITDSGVMSGEVSIDITFVVALQVAGLDTGQRASGSNIGNSCFLARFYSLTGPFRPCLFLRSGYYPVSGINALHITTQHLLALFQTRQFLQHSLAACSRFQQSLGCCI